MKSYLQVILSVLSQYFLAATDADPITIASVY